jgi:hypothetical protein
MSRYVKRPAARPTSRLYVEDHIFPDERPGINAVEVDSHEAADTGLLWADGSTVWRAPNPLGFGRNEEWNG